MMLMGLRLNRCRKRKKN